ncbi:MAG: D-2-hydroxyacid dehydrogenase [Pyrinomonadaceae bacterium]
MDLSMERIVFLDRSTIKALIRPPAFAHEWRDYAETKADEVAGRIADATIAITNKVPLREADIARARELKFIAVAATGVDVVDLAACRKRGIGVANVRGYARHSVPEHALMLMLALRRNLLAYRRDVERGAWQKSPQFCLLDHTINELHGSTLGIIGYGITGRALEKLALAFGMRVLVAEHKHATQLRKGRVGFEEILRACDIVSLHCPLTPETQHLIGAAELAKMSTNAVLINCARGALVDESALVESLQKKLIAGAGFDVLSEEPPRDGNPLLQVQLPNLIVTPHVAWASREAMQLLADQLIDNLEAFIRADPQNLVA